MKRYGLYKFIETEDTSNAVKSAGTVPLTLDVAVPQFISPSQEKIYSIETAVK